MTRSAFSASITAPGPTGIPAARSARAKPMTLSAIRPVAGVVMRDSIRSSFRGAPLGASPESILPIVVMDSGFVLRTPRNDVRLLILARCLFQNLLQRVAMQPRDVVLIFQ